MRQDSYPDTLDPRLLSLNEYPIAPTNTTHDIPIADENVDDDIAIASGQVDPEDGIGSRGIYKGIGLDGQGNLAPELELSDNFGIRYPLAMSAVSLFLAEAILQ